MNKNIPPCYHAIESVTMAGYQVKCMAVPGVTVVDMG